MQKRGVAFILVFWAGFVSAISFLEAWLKFKAPGITLPLGLGIGKLVFAAMNRTEWFFLLLFVVAVVWSRRSPRKINRTQLSLFVGLVVVLAVQTFWLLPVLNHRADLIIAGQVPGESLVHIFYGIAEVLKVTSLFVLAFVLTRQKAETHR